MPPESNDSEAPLYDWNSDDEPPTDQPLDASVISVNGNAVKYLIHIGNSFDKPGLGDRVHVRWKRVVDPMKCMMCISTGLRESESLPELKRYVDDWLSSGEKTEVDLGYNEALPYIVEKTVRTMRETECSVVICDNAAPYTEIVSDSARKKDNTTSYDVIHKERMRGIKRVLLQMGNFVSSFSSNNVTSQRFKDCKAFYVIELIDFHKKTAITEDRSIVKESITSVAAYFPAPREGDTVVYTWYYAKSNSDHEAVSTDPTTVQRFSGTLRADSIQPVPQLYRVLLEMRRGEKCKVTIKEPPHTLNASHTLIVHLLDVLHRGQISLNDIKSPVAAPIAVLSYQELLGCQLGIKQQVSVENGCRIAAVISFHNKTTLRSGCFPFNSTLRGCRPISAHLVTLTVGTGVVPAWVDTVIQVLQPGSRIRVQLPTNQPLFHKTCYHEALWPAFIREELFQDRFIEPFRDMNSKNEISAWTDVRVCNDARVQNAAECWLSTSFAKTLCENNASDPLHTSIARKASCSVDCVNIIHTLGNIVGDRWNPLSGSIRDMAVLREWLTENSVNGYWDSEAVRCAVLQSSGEDIIELDVQLVDVLERVAMPWTFSETERLKWGVLWKRFGNYLFNRRFFALAISYYRRALEVIRFSPSIDSPGVCCASSISNDAQHREKNLASPDSEDDINDTTQQDVIEALYASLQHNIGLCYLSSKCWKETISASEACLKKSKRSNYYAVKALYRLAVAHYELGSYNECRKYITEFQKRDPSNPATTMLLRKLRAAEQQDNAAQKALYSNIFNQKPKKKEDPTPAL